MSSPVADSLSGARWLTPFGVAIRYPGDSTEMLPGDEAKAIEIASQVRQAVLAILKQSWHPCMNGVPKPLFKPSQGILQRLAGHKYLLSIFTTG